MVDHPELGQKLPMEFSTIVVIHLLNVTSPSVCTSSVHFYVEIALHFNETSLLASTCTLTSQFWVLQLWPNWQLENCTERRLDRRNEKGGWWEEEHNAKAHTAERTNMSPSAITIVHNSLHCFLLSDRCQADWSPHLFLLNPPLTVPDSSVWCASFGPQLITNLWFFFTHHTLQKREKMNVNAVKFRMINEYVYNMASQKNFGPG